MTNERLLIDAIEQEMPYCPDTDYEIGYQNGLSMAKAIAIKLDAAQVQPGQWIDNADSYICPICGFETDNPNRVYCKCPKCGFMDMKDVRSSDAVDVAHGLWIPVTEQLPEDYVDVLACDVRDGFQCVGFLKHKQWVCSDNFFYLENITHWMPLPELPAKIK